MDSTPVTRRSKRVLTAANSAQKKQKTSTPSRSRIEHYMSPGNISKVVGSPIQHQQSTLHSITVVSDSLAGGERSSFSQRLGGGDQNRKGKGKGVDSARKTEAKGDAGLRKSNKRSENLLVISKASSSGAHSMKRSSKKVQNSQKSSQKKANLSSTLQNATIDKYMSADVSSSAVTTPTRFPRSADNDSSSENEESGNGSRKRKTISERRSEQPPAGTDSSLEEEPTTSTVGTKHSKQNTRITGKCSSRFLASGDINAHMEDKDFIASQVMTLSKPLIMEEGPSQWIDTWKARQSYNEEEETEAIPEKVMHKTVAKVNNAMSCDLAKRLSRQQQRKVLINLDEIRKEGRVSGIEERQKGMPKLGASLPEILKHYPSEWEGTEESSSDDEMAQRYKEVHSRLSALSESLTKKEEEKEQLQNMCRQLQEINENLRSCTDSDFKKELDRTKSLVSQILKKVSQRRSPRKHTTSTSTDHQAAVSKEAPVSMESYGYQPMGHEALVRQLLASTF